MAQPLFCIFLLKILDTMITKKKVWKENEGKVYRTTTSCLCYFEKKKKNENKIVA